MKRIRSLVPVAMQSDKRLHCLERFDYLPNKNYPLSNIRSWCTNAFVSRYMKIIHKNPLNVTLLYLPILVKTLMTANRTCWHYRAREMRGSLAFIDAHNSSPFTRDGSLFRCLACSSLRLSRSILLQCDKLGLQTGFS